MTNAKAVPILVSEATGNIVGTVVQHLPTPAMLSFNYQSPAWGQEHRVMAETGYAPRMEKAIPVRAVITR